MMSQPENSNDTSEVNNASQMFVERIVQELGDIDGKTIEVNGAGDMRITAADGSVSQLDAVLSGDDAPEVSEDAKNTWTAVVENGQVNEQNIQGLEGLASNPAQDSASVQGVVNPGGAAAEQDAIALNEDGDKKIKDLMAMENAEDQLKQGFADNNAIMIIMSIIKMMLSGDFDMNRPESMMGVLTEAINGAESLKEEGTKDEVTIVQTDAEQKGAEQGEGAPAEDKPDADDTPKEQPEVTGETMLAQGDGLDGFELAGGEDVTQDTPENTEALDNQSPTIGVVAELKV